MHVAVFAFPFGCHALSLINLVQKLARAAQETQFSFLNTEESNNSIFLASRTNLPDNIKTYNVTDGVPLNHVFSGDPIERVELFIKETPKNFKMALDMAVAETGQKISCLIADAFLSFSGSVAEDLSIPWIPVWIPVPHSLSTHIYTDMIRQHYANSLSYGCSNSCRDGNDVELEEKTLEIPGLSELHIADLPVEVLPRDAQETPFSCLLGQIGNMVLKVDTLVVNFYQELYPKPLLNDLKSKFSNLLNVGFISLSMPPPSLPPSTEDTTGCLSWLDSQKSKTVAYISFGTVANIPQSEIEELTEALEASRIPFLWSLRDNIKDCLPNGFLERTIMHGKVVPWAPQTQVLAHSSTGVFMTHCGANSVYESIANGIPMICRPFFADNKLNARLIVDVWRIGERIDGGTGVAKSLDLILQHEQGRRIRSRVLAVKELVLKASAPGGHATQAFKTLVEKITLRPAFMMGFVGLLKLAVKCLDILSWPVFGLGYPLCASILAIETNSNSDTQKLITYWVSISVVLLFEHTFQLQWLAFWPYIKLMIVGCLVLPYFHGSLYVYKHLVLPCLSIGPRIITCQFNKLKLFFKKDDFLVEVKRYMKENGSDALEDLIASTKKSAKPNAAVNETKAVAAEDWPKSEQPKLPVRYKDGNAVKITEKMEVASTKQLKLEQPKLPVRLEDSNAVEVTEKKEVKEVASTEQLKFEQPKLPVLFKDSNAAEITEKREVTSTKQVRQVESNISQTENSTFPPLEFIKHSNNNRGRQRSMRDTTSRESPKCMGLGTDTRLLVNGLKDENQIPKSEVSPVSEGKKFNVTTATTGIDVTCVVCQLTLTNQIDLSSHLQGKRHKKACELMNSKIQASNSNVSPSSVGKNANFPESKPEKCTVNNSTPPGNRVHEEKKLENLMKSRFVEIRDSKWWCTYPCIYKFQRGE
ncbi:hypothetical protein NC652_022445 [Populus alba x Populus x berolinensis]|nr:hypothetical protein NC652_022445 [Populus alba x Populus x berolinensis]